MHWNPGLGKKIGCGFLIVLAMTVVVGGAGFIALRYMTDGVERFREIQIVQYHFHQAKEHTDLWLLNNYPEGRAVQVSAEEDVRAALDRASGQMKNLPADIVSRKIAGELVRLQEEITGYHDKFNAYVASESEKIRLQDAIQERHEALFTIIRETPPLFTENMIVAARLLSGTISFYFTRNDELRWRNVEAAMTEMTEAFDAWWTRIENSPVLTARGEKIREQFSHFERLVRAYQEEVIRQQNILAELNRHTDTIKGIFSTFRDLTVENLGTVENASNRIILWVTLAALLFGAFFGFFLTRNITGSIRSVIDRLDNTSDILHESTDHLTTASTSLSGGATEQAASLEEVASSLEEMVAMIRQNAENTEQARLLMDEANQIVSRANTTMSDLTRTMTDVSQAGEETARIINLIDEIAFQTNLLALNAAVEAARAGQAGAGFAVVAGEVKNLAERAAEAARNTTERIQGTVKMVQEGAELVTRTSDAFSEVTDSAARVGELIRELALASDEQANGIEQISRATVEMDHVVQQNAASAEESASISRNLGNEAGRMRGAVIELIRLIGGRKSRKEIPISEGAEATPARTAGKAPPPAPDSAPETPAVTRQKKKPVRQIALDENRFDDF